MFYQGFLVNWDVQKNVWDYIFSKECCYANFSEIPLIVTEPYFNFSSIQEAMSEIFFEEYDCQSLLRINGMCRLLQSQLMVRSDPKSHVTIYLVFVYALLFPLSNNNKKRLHWYRKKYNFCLKTT